MAYLILTTLLQFAVVKPISAYLSAASRTPQENDDVHFIQFPQVSTNRVSSHLGQKQRSNGCTSIALEEYDDVQFIQFPKVSTDTVTSHLGQEHKLNGSSGVPLTFTSHLGQEHKLNGSSGVPLAFTSHLGQEHKLNGSSGVPLAFIQVTNRLGLEHRSSQSSQRPLTFIQVGEVTEDASMAKRDVGNGTVAAVTNTSASLTPGSWGIVRDSNIPGDRNPSVIEMANTRSNIGQIQKEDSNILAANATQSISKESTITTNLDNSANSAPNIQSSIGQVQKEGPNILTAGATQSTLKKGAAKQIATQEGDLSNIQVVSTAPNNRTRKTSQELEIDLPPLPQGSPRKPLTPLEKQKDAHVLPKMLMVAFLVVIAVYMFYVLVVAPSRRSSHPSTLTSKKVESLRVTSAAEIQSMFAMKSSSISASVQPLSPGILMRLQGRIVAKPGGALVAPLSGRSCVIYSASVSNHHQDAVHQPPMAYHTAGTDFAIELADVPHVTVMVRSNDVSLFDMDSGRHSGEFAFTDAPDPWRGFMLAHLSQGLGTSSASSQVDLGCKGLMDFRECALLVGATVTCVGEISRDHNNVLSLCPWQPAMDATAAPEAGKQWLPTSWEKISRAPGKTEANPLVGHVMISDNSALLNSLAKTSKHCRTCS